MSRRRGRNGDAGAGNGQRHEFSAVPHDLDPAAEIASG
jgi:hypothetical protein